MVIYAQVSGNEPLRKLTAALGEVVKEEFILRARARLPEGRFKRARAAVSTDSTGNCQRKWSQKKAGSIHLEPAFWSGLQLSPGELMTEHRISTIGRRTRNWGSVEK